MGQIPIIIFNFIYKTNCYKLSNGIMVYKKSNGELYFTSKHAILNLVYQVKTKEPKKAEPILTIKEKY